MVILLGCLYVMCLKNNVIFTTHDFLRMVEIPPILVGGLEREFYFPFHIWDN